MHRDVTVPPVFLLQGGAVTLSVTVVSILFPTADKIEKVEKDFTFQRHLSFLFSQKKEPILLISSYRNTPDDIAN